MLNGGYARNFSMPHYSLPNYNYRPAAAVTPRYNTWSHPGYLAARPAFDALRLGLLALGTSLAAGGVASLNQWMEGETDGRMSRTALRPIPAGKIAGQVPLAGSRTPRGTAIQAFVSTGAGAVAIPTLTGARPDDAVEQLRNRKLSAGHRREEASDTVAAGLVIGTDPPAGRAVSPDAEVTLIISTGRAMKPVPKVLGLRLSKAKKALEEAGFKGGTTRTGSSDTYDEAVIIKQDPAENTPAAPGSAVNLVVNE